MAENTLSEKQTEVVSVLQEGRATPKHIVDNSSLPSKHAAQHHLRELRLAGHVEKVNSGLYGLAADEAGDDDE